MYTAGGRAGVLWLAGMSILTVITGTGGDLREERDLRGRHPGHRHHQGLGLVPDQKLGRRYDQNRPSQPQGESAGRSAASAAALLLLLLLLPPVSCLL
jgi:hypothetical protein